MRKGIHLGEGVTNNEAESTGVLEGLRELAALQDGGRPHLDAPIRVLGDSQLVV